MLFYCSISDSVFDADLLDDTILDRLIRRYREQLQNVKRLNKGLNEEDIEGKF